ncbi:MAG TPA: FAD-dependent oxidoreductase [Bacillota bacterium]
MSQQTTFREGLSAQQVAAEAARCLYCYDAPCVKGCPAGVNIPVFIKKIHSGNWRGAVRVIRETNIFGGVCGRVCPTEHLCEKECSSRLLGRAIPIGALQRAACDHEMARGFGALAAATAPMAPAAGKKAAVIGAGPAGLAAAHEFRLMGWEVTVYEAGEAAGGQLRLTIPPYRLPAEVVEAEVEAVLATGVEVKTGVVVGRDISAEKLLAENDAVILAAGLGGGRPLEVPGEALDGVVGAEDFLAEARAGRGRGRDLRGRKVVVVGGGNTAMDAATTAARANADRVTVVYRRSSREMPAWSREYQTALAAGAEFAWLAGPVALEPGRSGGVGKVSCVRMALGSPDASGRAAPVPIPGSEFTIDADLVLMALGQGPNTALAAAFGLKLGGGRPVLGPDGRTGRDKLFVAGDFENGGATVVRAVAEGRQAARRAAEPHREGRRDDGH